VLLQLLALAWLAGASVAALGGPVASTALASALVLGWGRGRPWALRGALGVSLVAVAFAGAHWYSSHRPSASPDDVSHFVGAGPARVTGTVQGDTQERQQAVLVRLDVSSVEDDRGTHPASGLLLLRLAKSVTYEDGDRIQVRGKPVTPKDLEGFDYAGYLARQDIFAEVDYPSTRLIAHADEGAWRRALLAFPLFPPGLRSALSRATASACVQSATRLRQCLVTGLGATLPEPEASVGADIAFGTRRIFDPAFESALTRTGTAQIVVATGYNVTIMAVFGLAAFSWLLGRRWALIVTLVLIGGYSVFIGLTPSVLRAALMGAIVVGAGLAGRPHSGLRALIIAAAFMVIISPLALDDLSFPLSLASTAGLFVLAEPLGAALRSLLHVPDGGTGRRAWLGSAVDSSALTASASVASLPILIWSFGTFSVSTLPANMILFPMVPWVMGAAGITALAGVVARPVAVVFAPPAYAVLRALVLVIQLSAVLPGAEIHVGPVGVTLVLALAVSVLVLSDITPAGRVLRGGLRVGWQRLCANADADTSVRLWRSLSQRVLRFCSQDQSAGVGRWLTALSALSVGLIAALLVHAVTADRAPAARVTYLDVGSGSAILVESGGSRILVDGGPAGGGTLRALDALLAPWERSLSLIVVANASPEHVGGLSEVVARYRVDAFADAAPAPANPVAEQDLMKTVAASQVRELPRGSMVVNAGAATMTIRPAERSLDGKSPSSAIVELSLGDRRFLLAGDAQGAVPADVRGFSPTTETVPAIPPRIEVLEAGAASAAASDLAGVPEGLRSALLYRTVENGTITIETDGRRLSVRVEHGPRFGLLSRIR